MLKGRKILKVVVVQIEPTKDLKTLKRRRCNNHQYKKRKFEQRAPASIRILFAFRERYASFDSRGNDKGDVSRLFSSDSDVSCGGSALTSVSMLLSLWHIKINKLSQPLSRRVRCKCSNRRRQHRQILNRREMAVAQVQGCERRPAAIVRLHIRQRLHESYKSHVSPNEINKKQSALEGTATGSVGNEFAFAWANGVLCAELTDFTLCPDGELSFSRFLCSSRELPSVLAAGWYESLGSKTELAFSPYADSKRAAPAAEWEEPRRPIPVLDFA